MLQQQKTSETVGNADSLLTGAPSANVKTTTTTRRSGSRRVAFLALSSALLISLVILNVNCQLAPGKTIEVLSLSTIEEKTSSTGSPSETTTTTTTQTILPAFQTLANLKSLEETSTESITTSLSSRETTTTISNNNNNNNNNNNGNDDNEEDESSTGPESDVCSDSNCLDILDNPKRETKNLTDVQRLVNLQTFIQEGIKLRLKSATRGSMELFERLSLSGGCSSSLMNLVSSIIQIKSFAFKFADASAKIPSGVMYGLLSDFGDFDQCLAIRSSPGIEPEFEAEEGAYSGKYCLVSIKLNYKIKVDNDSVVPDGIQADGILWDELIRNYWTRNATKGFQLGICLPSRCTDNDINQIYQLMAADYNFSGKIITCQDSLDLKRQHQADWIQRIIINLFYILLSMTIVGTIVERYRGHGDYILDSHSDLDSKKPAKNSIYDKLCCCSNFLIDLELIACFSIARNWRLFMGQPVGTNRKYCVAPQWDSLTTSDDQDTCRSPTSLNTQSKPTIDEPSRNQDGDVVEQTNRLCEELSIRIQLSEQADENRDGAKPTSGEQNAISLSHLSGLKLFVILWITSGHSFLYPSANNYQHYRSIINMNITRNSVWFASTNFTLGIDMLLYMIGLVFVYKLAHLSKYQKDKSSALSSQGSSYSSSNNSLYRSSSLKNRKNIKNEQTVDKSDTEWFYNVCIILRFISRKVLRFWPTYFCLIAFAIIVPLFSDGPMWPEMISKRIGQSCRDNWWSNLLFINNYSLNESQICLPSSWFISVLMQLFLIGSIIVLIARKYSLKLALFIIGFLLISSINIIFSIVYIEHLQAPVIRMDESFVMELDHNIFRMYVSLINNMGPFLTGMLGGFILISVELQMIDRNNNCNNKDKRKQKPIQIIINILKELLVAIVVVLIATAVLSSVFYEHYSRLSSAIYWSCHRIGWAIVTGYIVHQCATKRCWKILKDILSLSTFIPLSKLIFIAYLVHPILIHMHSGLVRDGLHVSIYNMMNIYITRLFMTFAIALVIHLVVELPLCSLEDILIQRWLKSSNQENNQNNGKPEGEESAQTKSIRKLLPLLIVAPSLDANRKPAIRSDRNRGDYSIQLLSTSKSIDDPREESCQQTEAKINVTS